MDRRSQFVGMLNEQEPSSGSKERESYPRGNGGMQEGNVGLRR